MLMSHHLHTLDAHVPSPTLDAHVPSHTLDAHVPSPSLDAHVPSPTYTRCSCPITYTRCSCPITYPRCSCPITYPRCSCKDTFMMTMKEVKSYRMHYSNSTPKKMSHSFMLQGKHLHTTKLRMWHKILGVLV